MASRAAASPSSDDEFDDVFQHEAAARQARDGGGPISTSPRASGYMVDAAPHSGASTPEPSPARFFHHCVDRAPAAV